MLSDREKGARRENYLFVGISSNPISKKIWRNSWRTLFTGIHEHGRISIEGIEVRTWMQGAAHGWRSHGLEVVWF